MRVFEPSQGEKETNTKVEVLVEPYNGMLNFSAHIHTSEILVDLN